MAPSSHFAKRLTPIIGNSYLAAHIYESLSVAMRSGFVRLSGRTPWCVFESSLEHIIWDIEADARVDLFRRLLRYGPAAPSEVPGFSGSDKKTLSDEECEDCVNFIFDRLISAFKGELAELLGIGAVVDLVRSLRGTRRLPQNVQVYWGDTIEQRKRIRRRAGEIAWGSFCKGADGLLVQHHRGQITVLGIVEVKSMRKSLKQIRGQILDDHLSRLKGGLRLQGEEWSAARVLFCVAGATGSSAKPFFVTITPSSWKLSRKLNITARDRSGRVIIFSPHKPPRILAFDQDVPPQKATVLECIDGRNWRIILGWSKEALAQAAFEMTFWYMARVGAQIYSKRTLPHTWKEMTHEKAGQNAIKQSLYFILERPLSDHAYIRAIRLYNAYAFGYPLSVDTHTIRDAGDFV